MPSRSQSRSQSYSPIPDIYTTATEKLKYNLRRYRPDDRATEALLKEGANINDALDFSTLHTGYLLGFKDYKKMLKLFVKHGLNVVHMKNYMKVYAKDAEIADIILSAGKIDVNETDEDGYTYLMNAMLDGDYGTRYMQEELLHMYKKYKYNFNKLWF